MNITARQIARELGISRSNLYNLAFLADRSELLEFLYGGFLLDYYYPGITFLLGQFTIYP